jgi:lipid-A-disaccharide synthase-like uncharacterized protein
MNLFDVLNVALIMSIIILIQFFKIKIFDNKVKKQVWYFVLIGAGLLCSFLVTDFNNFSVQSLLSNIIMYAAASMFFYETGKMGYNKLFVKKKDEK